MRIHFATLYLLSDTGEKEKAAFLGSTEYFQYSERVEVMSFDNGCTEITD